MNEGNEEVKSQVIARATNLLRVKQFVLYVPDDLDVLSYERKTLGFREFASALRVEHLGGIDLGAYNREIDALGLALGDGTPREEELLMPSKKVLRELGEIAKLSLNMRPEDGIPCQYFDRMVQMLAQIADHQDFSGIKIPLQNGQRLLRRLERKLEREEVMIRGDIKTGTPMLLKDLETSDPEGSRANRAEGRRAGGSSRLNVAIAFLEGTRVISGDVAEINFQLGIGPNPGQGGGRGDGGKK